MTRAGRCSVWVAAALVLLLSAVRTAESAATLGTDVPYAPGKCNVTGCDVGLCCAGNGMCGNSSFYCGSGCINGNCETHTTTSGMTSDKAVVVAVSLGALAGIVFFMLLLACYCKPRAHPWDEHLKGLMFQRFSMNDVKLMTKNFNEKRVLGRGALWAVYRGHTLVESETQKRTPCAVKVHHEMTSYAFEKEVKSVAALRHKNMVTLLGYCADVGTNVLVYEYDVQRSLYARLYPDEGKPVLSFQQRLTIAKGIADAIRHLHSNNITLCDIVPTNIVVEQSSEPKVADMGFFREIEGNKGSIDLPAAFTDYLASNAGYLDPEQGSRNRAGWKVDVYRFGVLMLELMTGRPSIVSHSDRMLAVACQEAAKKRGGAPTRSPIPLTKPYVVSAPPSRHTRTTSQNSQNSSSVTSSSSSVFSSPPPFDTRRTRHPRRHPAPQESPMHISEWVVVMRSSGVLPGLLDARMLESEKLALVQDPQGREGQYQRQALELYISLALSCAGPCDVRSQVRDIVATLTHVERLWHGGRARDGDAVVDVDPSLSPADGAN